MAETTRSAGVHSAIGLQTNYNPAAQRARELVASGALGRILTARMYSGTMAFSQKIGAADAYLEDAGNGATLVSIHGGHALDLAVALLGDLKEISALATTQYPEIQVGDDSARRTRSIPDHLLVQSRLADGGALSIEVAGGRKPEESLFRLEVAGDRGSLALDGGAPRGFQSSRLKLSLKGEPQPVDEAESQSLPDTAANVAGLYAALRDDILNDTRTVPSFDRAVSLCRLLDGVMSSAQTGRRQPVNTV